jgi:hypothetical protein
MWHVLHLIARPIAALLGVFCLVTATLLYPKEDGTIQSKLEDFWVKVDDYKISTLSRHTAFMVGVARLETHILDWIFGRKIISIQSFIASAWCSTASFIVAGTVLAGLFHFYVLIVPMLVVFLFGFSVVYTACLLKPTIHRKLLMPLGWMVIGVPLIIWTLSINQTARENVSFLLLVMFLGGFVCDVLFIVITRKLVRWAGDMNRLSALVGLPSRRSWIYRNAAVDSPGSYFSTLFANWYYSGLDDKFIRCYSWLVFPYSSCAFIGSPRNLASPHSHPVPHGLHRH